MAEGRAGRMTRSSVPPQEKAGRAGAPDASVTPFYPPDPSDRLRVRAAWLYFVEGRTQSDIAEMLDVGRVTVVRLLAEARARREVRIQIEAPLADLTRIERGLEQHFRIGRVVVAPHDDAERDPTQVIAAAAGAFISNAMRSGIQVGVGWGRTLYSTLPFTIGRSLDGVRVVSLLGGIAQARNYNPAEFAWQFNQLFRGEGFLVPAPALVDSAETKTALMERCGLKEIFERVDTLDMVLLSVGGISTLNTSYRVGHVSEEERLSLIEAGAVGDLLYHFIDAEGRVVDHPINTRAIAADIARLCGVPSRVLVSGGADKVPVLEGSIRALEPTALVTDEQTALALLARAGR